MTEFIKSGAVDALFQQPVKIEIDDGNNSLEPLLAEQLFLAWVEEAVALVYDKHQSALKGEDRYVLISHGEVGQEAHPRYRLTVFTVRGENQVRPIRSHDLRERGLKAYLQPHRYEVLVRFY